MSDKQRIALLIDCDNVSHNAIEGVLEELAARGAVNVRHAHGDWNSTFLSGWMEKLHIHAIRPMQQFAYTKNKNSTDSAMIIDAMDLLYSGNIDAFALMTSDCDFTPLAHRIRENGMSVYGFGAEKTPKAFVNSCSPFIYIENLIFEEKDDNKKVITLVTKRNKENLTTNKKLVKLLRTAAEQMAGDDGWSHLGQVGKYISNNNNSFSQVNYGYKKLGDLIKATKLFNVEMRNNGNNMYIKLK